MCSLGLSDLCEITLWEAFLSALLSPVKLSFHFWPWSCFCCSAYSARTALWVFSLKEETVTHKEQEVSCLYSLRFIYPPAWQVSVVRRKDKISWTYVQHFKVPLLNINYFRFSSTDIEDWLAIGQPHYRPVKCKQTSASCYLAVFWWHLLHLPVCLKWSALSQGHHGA